MKLYYFVSLALFIKSSCQDLVWEELMPKSGISRRDAAIGYDTNEDAVYIFGGMSAKNKPVNDMFKFDLNTKIWTPITQIGIKARFGMVYGSRGDYFYIATGEGMKKIVTGFSKLVEHRRSWSNQTIIISSRFSLYDTCLIELFICITNRETFKCIV